MGFLFLFQVNRPDSHRRKWDRDEYEKKAKQRDDEEKEKRRDYAKNMNDAAMARATARAASGKKHFMSTITRLNTLLSPKLLAGICFSKPCYVRTPSRFFFVQ